MSTAAASGLPDPALVLFVAPGAVDGTGAGRMVGDAMVANLPARGATILESDGDRVLASFPDVTTAGEVALSATAEGVGLSAVLICVSDLPALRDHGDPAGTLMGGAGAYLEPGVVLALGEAGAVLADHGMATVTPFGQAVLDGATADVALARVEPAPSSDATAFAAPAASASAAAAAETGASAGSAKTGASAAPAAVPSGGETDIGPGFVLSHTYEIVELIGRGGMGTVYRARHLDLGTQHAIKIVSPEHGADERVIGLFRREAESLRRVRHDAIVSYDGVIRDEYGRLYLVMEFAEGPSLNDVIAERRLSEDEVGRLFDRLAQGLQAAHDKGIVHRDLSPDNIILGDNDIDHAKIIDFGIARDLEASARTLIGSDFAGKYGYASPEQLGLFGGQVDNRSDVYSLGLVMAKVLGLQLDLGRTLSAAVERRQSLPDLSGARAPWTNRLAAMLAPDPANRPGSLWALLDTPGSPSVKPGTAGAPSGANRGSNRRRWLAPGLGLLLIGVAGGGWLGWQTVTQPGMAEIRARLATQIAERLPEPACGYVAHALRPAATGDGFTLALRGVVGAPEAVRQLRESVAGLPHLAGVSDGMRVHPPPFCAILTQLRPFGGPGAPALSLNRADATYAKGERLILTASAGLAGDQHLYVSSVDGDGNVVHMLPNGLVPDNALGQGERVTLGDGDEPGDHRVYRAAPPFGENLLIAVAASTPLFDQQRPEVEMLDAYLPALRRALATAQDRGDRVAVRHTFFSTEQ
jgi:hypothetical protein